MPIFGIFSGSLPNKIMNGFKYYEREALETDVYTDFDTDNLKAKAIERYSFGCSNFRAGWGSQGAS